MRGAPEMKSQRRGFLKNRNVGIKGWICWFESCVGFWQSTRFISGVRHMFELIRNRRATPLPLPLAISGGILLVTT